MLPQEVLHGDGDRGLGWRKLEAGFVKGWSPHPDLGIAGKSNPFLGDAQRIHVEGAILIFVMMYCRRVVSIGHFRERDP